MADAEITLVATVEALVTSAEAGYDPVELEAVAESVNRCLPKIYAVWMDGRLIHALAGTRWGPGRLVKRSG
ncbi:MAG: hypothetical protein ACYDH5_08575, partial [Acidimicrobiales bacterium]